MKLSFYTFNMDFDPGIPNYYKRKQFQSLIKLEGHETVLEKNCSLKPQKEFNFLYIVWWLLIIA